MRKTFLVMSRLIDLFVDILPIDELGFKHVKLQSEGRPPYNPATLLKLYLYGYKHSIRSSRKIGLDVGSIFNLRLQEVKR